MIGIYTINDDNNFGNRLQNYALQKVLNTNFGNTYTLQNGQGTKNDLQRYYSTKEQFLNTYFGVFVRSLLRSLKNNNVYFFEEVKRLKRQKKFRSFTTKFVPKFPDSFDSYQDLDQIVIGSDQIWNPIFRQDIDSDFLPDFEKKCKISYAASIGIDSIDEQLDSSYKRGVQSIRAISVREFSAKKYLEQFSNSTISVVLDPTLLLSKKEWLKLAEKGKKIVKTRYILTYFLGDSNIEEKKYINCIAKEKHLKVVEINSKETKYYCNVGPLEFLKLFSEAEMVFSDSFHAAVFSIIFNINFELFSRKQKGTSLNMNTRMETLFQEFNLTNRMHNNDTLNQLEVIDYEEINKVLDVQRVNSLDWLKQALDRGK